MRLRNLLRPIYLVRRVGYWVYQRRHPDVPWIAQGAIRYLDQELKPTMQGFEWGSGKSTAWFAARLKQLTSVEHDEAWHATTKASLTANGATNTDLRHIALEHPYEELYSPYYDPLPQYVTAIDEFADDHFDFILVDGYYRQPCALRALPKLKPGGLMVIDNTDWMHRYQWPIPLNWPLVHESRNVLGQTSIWQKPQQESQA